MATNEAKDSKVTTLELKLNDFFVKQLPALPKGIKKFFVDITPWATLFLAIVALWTVYIMWHWAHFLNVATNYTSTLNQIYGGNIAAHRLSFMIWLSFITLVIEAVLYLKAFTPLRAHKKSGWDLLFYAAIIDILYNLIVMFSDYGSVGNFIGSLIGSAIGFYVLFQIRAAYLVKK